MGVTPKYLSYARSYIKNSASTNPRSALVLLTVKALATYLITNLGYLTGVACPSYTTNYLANHVT